MNLHDGGTILRLSQLISHEISTIPMEKDVQSIIYLIGLIVIVLAILNLAT